MKVALRATPPLGPFVSSSWLGGIPEVRRGALILLFVFVVPAEKADCDPEFLADCSAFSTVDADDDKALCSDSLKRPMPHCTRAAVGSN